MWFKKHCNWKSYTVEIATSNSAVWYILIFCMCNKNSAVSWKIWWTRQNYSCKLIKLIKITIGSSKKENIEEINKIVRQYQDVKNIVHVRMNTNY